MTSNTLRVARLFEYVVAVLLHRNGYRAGVPQRYLQGRGTKHQIDVLAIDPLPMPFVFPTRILCEAKCYSENRKRTLGVSYVRNLFAEVTDLQQTLPRQKKMTLEPVYDEPVSCTYTGALFSTIGFAKPAIDYANSYAISLVPLPVELKETHIPKLMDKLTDFVCPSPERRGEIRGCFNNCFDILPFGWPMIQQVLATAGKDILELTSPEERRVFVYALDAMLSRCPMLREMNASLSIHRVASIGKTLVVVKIQEPDFRHLARTLAEHFLGRSDGGFSNFATVGVPPESDQSAIHGALHPGEYGRPEKMEDAPPGFERFAVSVLGVQLPVLAIRGTYKSLRGATKPDYFTLMLDFGLILNVRV